MSEPSDPTKQSVWEQRWHPLRREWVVVAAHRQDRPWLGEQEPPAKPVTAAYDAACTFCPRNARVSGAVNADYRSVHVFDNDRPCVGEAAPRDLAKPPRGYRSAPATGIARVVCFSERHDLQLSRMDPSAVDTVLQCFQSQFLELAARSEVAHVLMFENRGEATGVSNPHPHGQIYATNFVFQTIANEVVACREHFAAHRRSLWEDIVTTEIEDGRRVIAQHGSAVAFLPWFARYAYETFVGPRHAVANIAELGDQDRKDLAVVLHETLVRFDNLWRMPFPYVMALHQAPTDGGDHPGFGFHIEIHPPLRKPGLRKFLAGPETGGGNFLADTAPEDKARELRATAATHYDLP